MPGSDESPRPRTIGVVTTSRADYSHLHWILRDLQTEPATEPWVIALGAQLADEFGRTEREIERAGLPVHHRVECLLSSDTDWAWPRRSVSRRWGSPICWVASVLTS